MDSEVDVGIPLRYPQKNYAVDYIKNVSLNLSSCKAYFPTKRSDLVELTGNVEIILYIFDQNDCVRIEAYQMG